MLIITVHKQLSHTILIVFSSTTEHYHLQNETLNYFAENNVSAQLSPCRIHVIFG